MDRTEQYRMIVRRLVEEYAKYIPSHGQIETEAVIDGERDHYEVMHVGWDGVRRVHGCVIHLDIRGGKVGCNTTARPAPSLRNWSKPASPKEDIVLGFHPPEVRRHTAFALG
jgi:hypothetical protein